MNHDDELVGAAVLIIWSLVSLVMVAIAIAYILTK